MTKMLFFTSNLMLWIRYHFLYHVSGKRETSKTPPVWARKVPEGLGQREGYHKEKVWKGVEESWKERVSWMLFFIVNFVT